MCSMELQVVKELAEVRPNPEMTNKERHKTRATPSSSLTFEGVHILHRWGQHYAPKEDILESGYRVCVRYGGIINNQYQS